MSKRELEGIIRERKKSHKSIPTATKHEKEFNFKPNSKEVSVACIKQEAERYAPYRTHEKLGKNQYFIGRGQSG